MPSSRLLVAIPACLSFCIYAGAGQAMPFHNTQVGSLVRISSGCGIGINRGPLDGCNVAGQRDDHAHRRVRLKRNSNETPDKNKTAAKTTIYRGITEVSPAKGYDGSRAPDKAIVGPVSNKDMKAINDEDINDGRARKRDAVTETETQNLMVRRAESIRRITPSPPTAPSLADERFQDTNRHGK